MWCRAHRSTIYDGEPLPTAAVHSVVPAWQQSQPATRAERGFFSFWLPVLLVLCLALVSLAVSIVMFVLYIRPVLKAAEVSHSGLSMNLRTQQLSHHCAIDRLESPLQPDMHGFSVSCT